MDKGRLEAFSDGVIAVIITIMVLELKVPHGATIADFIPLVPTLVAYVLSYVNVGIYWNNHHHMLHATDRIDGRVMWTNLLLLFWLSLIPFATNWAGETHFAALPTATYGFVLMASALSYTLLQAAIIACNGPESEIARAVGSDWKGKVSLASYIVSLPVAFISPPLSAAIFVTVAALWFIPDRRIERLTVPTPKTKVDNPPTTPIETSPPSA
jgi:uncharacterized membrane protein